MPSPGSGRLYIVRNIGLALPGVGESTAYGRAPFASAEAPKAGPRKQQSDSEQVTAHSEIIHLDV
jgi:hypothetical protein